MKLGGNGFIAYDRDTNGQIVSQAFPALSTNPLDVSGAGDCFAFYNGSWFIKL